MSDRKVTVFAPLGTLDHQTGIINAIKGFAAAGYDVDVLGVRNLRYPAPVFDCPRVHVRYMPWVYNSDREPRILVTLLFTLWVLLSNRKLSLVFAGGIRGLVAAYACSLIHRLVIVNYQMELYVGSKLDTAAARIFKCLERRAIRRSLFTIEHSEERGRILAQDAGIPPDKIVVVPNAPSGKATERQSSFLHDRLGLQASVPLMLCPGTFGDAFETATAVQAAQFLPSGWYCVLHSVQPRLTDDPYLAKLRAIDRNSRVIFSLEPVPYSDLDELMASARIGMALYSSDAGENYSTVGLASGKLSHFLKNGVPVIVSPLPGLGDFVEGQGVGAALRDAAQLGDLVARIEGDRSGYRDRAARCFNEMLSYDRAFEAVLSRLGERCLVADR